MQAPKKSFLLLFATMAFTLSACSQPLPEESGSQYLTDSAITTKVKAAIFNDPSLKLMEITVTTYKGEVQLSGFVGNIEQTNRAVDDAKSVSGVTSVKNDMRVRGSMNPFYR